MCSEQLTFTRYASSGIAATLGYQNHHATICPAEQDFEKRVHGKGEAFNDVAMQVEPGRKECSTHFGEVETKMKADKVSPRHQVPQHEDLPVHDSSNCVREETTGKANATTSNFELPGQKAATTPAVSGVAVGRLLRVFGILYPHRYCVECLILSGGLV